MCTKPSNCGEKGPGLLFPVLQVFFLLNLTNIRLKSCPRDRFGDFEEEEEGTESEGENELYQTAMEGGREATEGVGAEDFKEQQRKRLSLFSGRARVMRRSVGFGATGISLGKRAGGSAVVQLGGGGQKLEQALMVETDRTRREVFPAPDVPTGNLRKVVRSPRKNRSMGAVIGAGRPSEMASEHLPKFGPIQPSRIPDFSISQACIPRHPELRPAVQVEVKNPLLPKNHKNRDNDYRFRVAGASPHLPEGSSRRSINFRGE